MITEISFEQILPLWLKLWPWHQVSTIEKHSCMMFTGRFFGLDYEPKITYFGIIQDDTVVAVNSGHTTPENLYRSRGLWVEPEYRSNGYGVALLEASIRKSVELGCAGTWSYPRDTSWATYNAAGFDLATDWIVSENNIKNAYCFMKNY